MGPFTWFLFVYTLGGLTFLPLVVLLILLHAHLTFPEQKEPNKLPDDDPAAIKRSGDDKAALRTATDSLAEEFHRKHESDVAAGYFAVCREYVPGGVNGKPPDRLSPAGEVVVQESPSVYQSMYRSLFDRSQKPSIEPNKDSGGKSTKRANNVFYVVLRHGHLMLYDDIQQLEVRYVVSLENHNVDLYSGGDYIPEGELWIKRNSIRLRRNLSPLAEQPTSLPFFLFSENMSEKEDFYFALLNNQAKGRDDSPPEPQNFDIKNMVTLVQKLHSSEEHLQTRWLNAAMGRLFLAMYKTPELEAFIRKKLTKKISRVKKPNFITKLVLQKIEPGEGAPFVTNPRLKDLTVNGDCTIEGDVLYTGNFRIEIAATARIDLGSRFKAREVELILAVTCRKLEGHGLVRFKPQPSNRLWYTFEKMPKIDLAIEPIVSSRQITYTVILKAIESRIREVIAETVVLPFWDDSPFSDTSTERFRGGIWKKESSTPTTTEIRDEDPEDEAEAGGEGTKTPELAKFKDQRFMSTPVLTHSSKSRAGKKSVASLTEALGVSSGVEKSPRADVPRMMRSSSFATAAEAKITASHADTSSGRSETKSAPSYHDASSILKDYSTKSLTASPSDSPAGTPPLESAFASAMKASSPSSSSKVSVDSSHMGHSRQRSTASSLLEVPNQNSVPSTPTIDSFDSGELSQGEGTSSKRGFASAARSITTADRKQALASINAAAASAQKWGWGVLNKNRHKEAQGTETAEVPAAPMGRGRPLPPPGIPLPPPERPSTKVLNFPIKRKAVPPPLLPQRPGASAINGEPSPSLKPPLLERRRRQSSMQNQTDPGDDEVLVVAAPTESTPASPLVEEHQDEFFGHGEAADEARNSLHTDTIPKLPPMRSSTPDNSFDPPEEVSGFPEGLKEEHPGSLI